MIVTTSHSVIYRANRLRFIMMTPLLILFTGLFAWLIIVGARGNGEANDAWFMIPAVGLFLWLDCMLVAKLVWPPEIDISLAGIRWSNPALLQWPKSYGWQDIDGPEAAVGSGGVPLLQFVVKGTGRKLKLPPSHFGASYDEMAAVISGARAGKLVSPDEWRAEHPPHLLRDWLLNWGLPLTVAALVVIVMRWFGH